VKDFLFEIILENSYNIVGLAEQKRDGRREVVVDGRGGGGQGRAGCW
jgi:hypothetical protein